MALLVDLTPLRASRDFRLLWAGQAVSFVGTTVTTAALPFQVFQETRSSVAVGLLGLAQLAPLLVFSLYGGALADAIDKRRLLRIVNVVSMACAAVLAANAAVDEPQVWLLFVIGAVASGSMAVSYPTTRSLLPLLLEPELRPAGYALQSTYGSFGMMAGPALAGALIGAFGLTTAYLLDVGTYVVALAVYSKLAPAPPVPGSVRASKASVLEGLRFLRGHSVIMSVFAIDLLAMVFGMPRALFPALSERLGGGPGLYGLLLSAVAAGAFLASVGSGWTGAVRRQGRAIIVAVGIWGAAVTVAGLLTSAVPVLLLLVVAGAADMISGVFRSAVAADVTPDELRGRVSGVEIAVYAGGPVLGDVEAGVVGGLLGVRFAIVSGGLACVAGAIAFATLVPSFARYVRRPSVVEVRPGAGAG